MTAWTASGTAADATLQNLGVNALQSLIATANTTSSGQYVFGGVNSSVAPMADYFSSTPSAAKTAIDTAFQTAFGCLPTDAAASTITASQMQGFLSGAFADQFSGSNWSSNWSSASSTNVSSQIAPGETIDASTNANQPGFQQLAEGYAMLSEFGGSQLSSADAAGGRFRGDLADHARAELDHGDRGRASARRCSASPTPTAPCPRR